MRFSASARVADAAARAELLRAADENLGRLYSWHGKIDDYPSAKGDDPGPDYPCEPGEEHRCLTIVWGCLRFIAARISALPPVIENVAGDQFPAPGWVRRPNGWCSFADLTAGAVLSLLHHGNWYLGIARDGAGRPVGVVPLDPLDVDVEADPVSGLLAYRHRGEMADFELIHQRYLAAPGNAIGVGCLDAARMGIKISDAAEGYVARHFSQGAQLQVAFTTKDVLPGSSKRDLAAQLAARTVGPKNAFAPLVLDGGLDVRNLAMTAEQAQFLETAKWSDSKIAAQVYGLPPSLMGANEPGSQLTYTNLQDREGQVWRDVLGPLAGRIEDALSRLLPAGRRLRLDNTQALAGSSRDRMAAAVQMALINKHTGRAIYGPNEIRAVTGHPAIVESGLEVDVDAGDEAVAGRESRRLAVGG